MNHGVSQSSGFSSNGKGAVAHGIELGQATGLEAARHQKEVTAGKNASSQAVIETDESSNSFREFPGEFSKGGFLLLCPKILFLYPCLPFLSLCPYLVLVFHSLVLDVHILHTCGIGCLYPLP